jgi:hypothetical protein
VIELYKICVCIVLLVEERFNYQDQIARATNKLCDLKIVNVNTSNLQQVFRQARNMM